MWRISSWSSSLSVLMSSFQFLSLSSSTELLGQKNFLPIYCCHPLVYFLLSWSIREWINFLLEWVTWFRIVEVCRKNCLLVGSGRFSFLNISVLTIICNNRLISLASVTPSLTKVSILETNSASIICQISVSQKT